MRAIKGVGLILLPAALLGASLGLYFSTAQPCDGFQECKPAAWANVYEGELTAHWVLPFSRADGRRFFHDFFLRLPWWGPDRFYFTWRFYEH